MSREQRLINMMFQITYAITHDRWLMSKSYEEKAEWIGEQLRKNGFEGGPLGSSWFHLKDAKD